MATLGLKFEGPKTWTPLRDITALATPLFWTNMVYCVFGLRIAKLAVSIAGLPVSRVNVCGPKAFHVQTGLPQVAVVKAADVDGVCERAGKAKARASTQNTRGRARRMRCGLQSEVQKPFEKRLWFRLEAG